MIIIRGQSLLDDEGNTRERKLIELRLPSKKNMRSRFLEERRDTERERGYVSVLLGKNVFSHRKV